MNITLGNIFGSPQFTQSRHKQNLLPSILRLFSIGRYQNSRLGALVLFLSSDSKTIFVMSISFGNIFRTQHFNRTRHKENYPFMNSSPPFNHKVSTESPCVGVPSLYSDSITTIVMIFSFGNIYGTQQNNQTRHSEHYPFMNSSPPFNHRVSTEPPCVGVPFMYSNSRTVIIMIR